MRTDLHNLTPSEAALLANVCVAAVATSPTEAVTLALAGHSLHTCVAGFLGKEITEAAVNKAVDDGIVRRKLDKRHAARRPIRQLDEAAVLFIVSCKVISVTLSKQKKRELYSWLADDRERNARTWSPSPMLQFVPGPHLKAWRNLINHYAEARDRHIVHDPEIMGGLPVIRGTRIPVYSVAARVDGGDSLEEIEADYPYVPLNALKAAVLYARSHAKPGRPRRIRD